MSKSIGELSGVADMDFSMAPGLGLGCSVGADVLFSKNAGIRAQLGLRLLSCKLHSKTGPQPTLASGSRVRVSLSGIFFTLDIFPTF